MNVRFQGYQRVMQVRNDNAEGIARARSAGRAKAQELLEGKVYAVDKAFLRGHGPSAALEVGVFYGTHDARIARLTSEVQQAATELAGKITDLKKHFGPHVPPSRQHQNILGQLGAAQATLLPLRQDDFWNIALQVTADAARRRENTH